MPFHEKARQTSGVRASIASVAARLMAEDGLTDYHQAKRKAARQLGLPDHTTYPDNAEVEAELRAYRSLYHDEEQIVRLRAMRQTALALLNMLEEFHPYLAGSVLDGTAGEHSHIDIQIFADSAKEVEIFLLNHGMVYEHIEPRNEKVEAVLLLETDTADANLVIYPPRLERVSLKTRDGRPRERIKAEGLRRLLAE